MGLEAAIGGEAGAARAEEGAFGVTPAAGADGTGAAAAAGVEGEAGFALAAAAVTVAGVPTAAGAPAALGVVTEGVARVRASLRERMAVVVVSLIRAASVEKDSMPRRRTTDKNRDTARRVLMSRCLIFVSFFLVFVGFLSPCEERELTVFFW